MSATFPMIIIIMPQKMCQCGQEYGKVCVCVVLLPMLINACQFYSECVCVCARVCMCVCVVADQGD